MTSDTGQAAGRPGDDRRLAVTVAREASAAPSTHSVIIIGDSIINGNKPGLEAGLATADIPNWQINSRSGRMITTAAVVNGSAVSSGLSAVDQVRAAGYESDFGSWSWAPTTLA